jgi:hypothetical protein
MSIEAVVRVRNATVLGMAAVACLWSSAVLGQAKGGIRDYDSPYYTLRSDVDPNEAHEFLVRMTVAVEAYHETTKAFGGDLRSKLKAFLYTREKDFIDSGGTPGNGMTTGSGHMSVLVDPNSAHLGWSGIMRWGFYQFSRSARFAIPDWVEGGMGFYFAQGVWTGDGLVTGVVSKSRLKKTRELIKSGFLPLREYVGLSSGEWWGIRRDKNEYQAWSLVHFLLHAEGGRRAKDLFAYFGDRGSYTGPWDKFSRYFGNDANAFTAAYNKYWQGLPDDPSADVRPQVVVATLTSILARGHALKMKFLVTDDLFGAAAEGKTQLGFDKDPVMWLPAYLAQDVLKDAPGLGLWSLDLKKSTPALVLTRADGETLTGTFTLTPGKHPAVKVETKSPKTQPASPP